MRLMKSCMIFFVLCSAVTVQAYIQSRSNSSGTPLAWSSGGLSLTHSPFLSLTGSGPNLQTIVNNSASQWSLSSVNIAVNHSGSGPVNGRNDLYYGTNASYFSSNPSLSSVLAVTIVSYEIATGRIVEADIEVNSAKTFSSEPDDTSPSNISSFYLGDVLTHEMGHFIGLGHSQMKDASMVFTVYRGLHTTSEDDLAGAASIYGDSQRVGRIQGTVVGSSSQVPVFGAQVMAISVEDGSAVASTYSDQNGSFAIRGLMPGHYYLYTAPGNTVFANNPSLSPLPYYYTSAQSNFCPSNSSYVGSFFQSCQSSDRGHPQLIQLTAGSPVVNVGAVAIRCSRDVSNAYTVAKINSLPLNLNNPGNGRSFIQTPNSKMGEGVVGYFSSFDQVATLPDLYSLDLSSVSSPSGKYLDIKVISGSLFFPTRVDLEVEDLNGVISQSTYSDVDDDSVTDTGLFKSSGTDNNATLEHALRIPLNSTSSDNVFDLKLTPRSLFADGLDFPGSASNENEWFFPVASYLMETSAYYLLAVTVTDSSGENLFPAPDSIQDNSSCSSDAAGTYVVQANKTGEAQVSFTTKRTSGDDVISCGTLAYLKAQGGGDDGPSAPSPWPLFTGLLLGAMTMGAMGKIRESLLRLAKTQV